MASIAHMAGESTGASGLLEANGLRPTDARTFDTTSDTGFGGAGSLSAIASACVSGALSRVEEMLATDSTAASVAVSGSAVDAGVAAAVTTPLTAGSRMTNSPIRRGSLGRCRGIHCRIANHLAAHPVSPRPVTTSDETGSSVERRYGRLLGERRCGRLLVGRTLRPASRRATLRSASRRATLRPAVRRATLRPAVRRATLRWLLVGRRCG